MHFRNAWQTLEKQFTPSISSNIVHVGGRYRVGKLLGTGGSGKLDSELWIWDAFLNLLGSVYLGKDIMMGSDIALKIGHQCSLPSKLSHKYNVYTTTASSRGISQVLWYGKEGVYKVIVLDYLRTSLGNLIDQLKFDHRKIFSYATQMVHLLYKTDDHTKYTVVCSSWQLSHFIVDIMSIMISNPRIS